MFVVLIAVVLLVCWFGLFDLIGLAWLCGFGCLWFVGAFGSCCVMFYLVLVL